jgi:hypothetical protein
MFDSEENREQLALIVVLLAEFYFAVEGSGAKCPLCLKSAGHLTECPLLLAWSMLDGRQREEVRKRLREATGGNKAGDEWPEVLDPP